MVGPRRHSRCAVRTVVALPTLWGAGVVAERAVRCQTMPGAGLREREHCGSGYGSDNIYCHELRGQVQESGSFAFEHCDTLLDTAPGAPVSTKPGSKKCSAELPQECDWLGDKCNDKASIVVENASRDLLGGRATPENKKQGNLSGIQIELDEYSWW